MAIRAGSLLEEARDAGKSLFVLHLGKGVLHRVDRAVVREVELGGVALVLGHVEDMALLHGPVQHDFLLVIGEVAIGHVDAHAHFLGDLRHERPHELAPGSDRALFERERVIGDERRLVDFAHDARAPAGGAGARAVEGEVLGARTIERLVADRAFERLFGSHVEAGRHVMAVRTFVAAQAREHETQIVEQLGGGSESGMHPGRGRALAQRDGSRHVQDLIHLCACGLTDAAARVGGKRLEIATTALRVQHAQGKRALSRSGYAGDADHLVQRDVDVDVLQVVDARTAHLDGGRLAKDDVTDAAGSVIVFVWHISSPSGMRHLLRAIVSF